MSKLVKLSRLLRIKHLISSSCGIELRSHWLKKVIPLYFVKMQQQEKEK